MKKSDYDRRQYKRFELKVDVLMQDKESKSGYFQFISQNMSEGGLLIVSDIPFERETDYKLVLTIDKKKFPINGKIVWVRSMTGKFGIGELMECGVEFVKIPRELKKTISDYLNKRAKS